MRLTLGALRKLLFEAMKDSDEWSPFYVQVRTADLIASLRPYEGQDVFAVFQTRTDFVPGTKIERQARMLAQRYGINITPVDVVHALKRDVIVKPTTKRPNSRELTLSVSPHEKTGVLLYMRDVIADRFNDSDIEAVMSVGSTAPMAMNLAHLVADFLDVPFVDGIKKIDDILDLGFDQQGFDSYAARQGPEKERTLRDIMVADVDRLAQKLKNAGAPKITKSFKPTTRKFFNVQKIDKDIDSGFVRTVLVVDDNVETSSTLRKLRADLESRGIAVLLAAGYKISHR